MLLSLDDFFVLDKSVTNSLSRTYTSKSHERKATTKPSSSHHSSMKVSLNSLFLHSLGDSTTRMVHNISSSVVLRAVYRKAKIAWVSEQGRGKVYSTYSLVTYTSGNGSKSMERMLDI